MTAPLHAVRVDKAGYRDHGSPEKSAQGLDSSGLASNAHEASLELEAAAAADGAANRQAIRVTLEWRDLRYSVPVGRRRQRTSRTILEGLSAVLPPGRLLAIMGPTGCGKSSLVNALAGRLPAGGTLEGEVLVNGLPRGRGFKSITAYVMQEDVMFANLTVFETLEFAARMRLPPSVSAADKMARNAFVRGVSGGERKRVNVGIELLSNPCLLLLDEPTVVATIHQPRSSIFALFDMLLVLSEGQATYYGPAAEAVEWFASCGFACSAHYNPADFFADVVAIDHRSPAAEEASKARVALLVERFNQQQRQRQQREAEQAAAVAAEDRAAMEQMNDRPSFPNSLPVEFSLLLRRAWKQQSRDRLPQVITLVQTLVLGFFLAALFSDIPSTLAGAQDELGVIFMSCMFNAMASIFASLNTFPVEAGIINRERTSKAYHVSPYYLARFLCDLPLRLAQSLLFGVIVYWIVGLKSTAGAFFIFCALTILLALASQALGVAVSAACPSEKVAFAVAPGITVILMLLGGFLVTYDSIPVWIRWLCWISHLYYAFMGLTINNFRGQSEWSCTTPATPDCTARSGDAILTRLGFEDKGMWVPFVGLACLTLGFNLAGYAVLRFTKQKFLPLTGSTAKKRA
ncbi:hypothetical protein COHA_006067 [Chlorella ohadii]|uniref:ABC transporter domain-containing protein n=1 Tax=Chlorella ohadii TaxID=2649997 RepID=A0AAD5DQT1_9CHLO|nr:hypothetical protein COHA_006067 [Chlorella ohadii]